MRQRYLQIWAFMGASLLFPGCEKAVEYHSPMGKYTVRLPREPEISTFSMNSPVGKVDMIVSAVHEGRVTYQVAFADFPAEMVRRASPKTILQSIQQQASTAVNGKITDVTWDGDQLGMRFILFVENGDSSNNYYLFRGDRLYELSAIGPISEVKGAAPVDFLHSIRFP